MNILELSEQEIVRRNNLQQLRDLGIDPYPAAEYPTDAFSTEIKENFVDLPTIKNEEGEEVPTPATPENSRIVCVAGRITSKRVQGKAAFVELLDSKGRIQVYITRDALCPNPEADGGSAGASSAASEGGTGDRPVPDRPPQG